nr:hypothetical protein [Clostridia bacterium]
MPILILLICLLALTSCGGYDTSSAASVPAYLTENNAVELTAAVSIKPDETIAEPEIVTTAPPEEAAVTVGPPETTAPETTAAEPVTEVTVQIPETTKSTDSKTIHVILNTNSGKYHLSPDCSAAKKMSPDNRLERDFPSVYALEAAGYLPCSRCASTESKPQTTTAEKVQTTAVTESLPKLSENTVYTAIININSKKIHLDPDCRHVKSMKESNRDDRTLDAEQLSAMQNDGYSLCKTCSQ